LVAKAERVIAMGGYNTICEVLSFEKRALIVPRVKPRREQIIRAERLRDMGLIDMLEADSMTPKALSDWMATDLAPLRLNDRIKLDGLSRLPAMAAQLLGKTPPEEPTEVAPQPVAALAGP